MLGAESHFIVGGPPIIEVRMTRRKREITGFMNERDFPHLVELKLPLGIVMEMQSGEGEVHQ